MCLMIKEIFLNERENDLSMIIINVLIEDRLLIFRNSMLQISMFVVYSCERGYIFLLILGDIAELSKI